MAHQGYFEGYRLAFEQPALIARLGLHESSHILEIGPGMGKETSQFCKISRHVHALDLSKSAVELVKKNAPAAHVSEYDGSTLDFEPSTFDLIYSCFVVQHMSKDHAKHLLQKCTRVLKDDGRALFDFFDCPRYNAGPNKNAYSNNHVSGERMYNNGFTKPEIKQFNDDLGMVIDWMETVFIGPVMGETQDIYNHWVCIKKRSGLAQRAFASMVFCLDSVADLNDYVRSRFPGLHGTMRGLAPLRALYRRFRRFQ